MQVRNAMQRHVTVVHEQDSLELAQQLMRWSELRELPVVDDSGRLLGLIAERDLLRAVTEHSDAPAALTRKVRDFMRESVECTEPDTDLPDAASRMSREGLECLPVTEREVLIGMLSASDALDALAQAPVIPLREPNGTPLVSAIMQPEPIAVPPQATLLSTAARMAERGVRHACVVDADRHVLGIVSDRDVRRVIGHPKLALVPNYVPESLKRLRVDHVMSAPTTVSQDASIKSALALLLSGQFSALPVTDAQGCLRGIVSYIDLLRHLRRVLAAAS